MGRDREREKDKQSKMLICNVRLTAGYIPALLYQRLMTLKTCTELHKMMTNPHQRPQRKSKWGHRGHQKTFQEICHPQIKRNIQYHYYFVDCGIIFMIIQRINLLQNSPYCNVSRCLLLCFQKFNHSRLIIILFIILLLPSSIVYYSQLPYSICIIIIIIPIIQNY